MAHDTSALLRGADVMLDDRTVLRGIDLAVGPGITVVRGDNGAGKTTLLRTLAGLLPLASGTRTAPADVLYLGHRPQLHRSLSAAENLAFFARYRAASHEASPFGRYRAAGDDGPTPPARYSMTSGNGPSPFAGHREAGPGDVTAALARWGVPDAPRPAERLSAGQRRRAALARLDTEPCALVLLDEPFAELDDDAVARLRETVRRCAARGQAIVIATHGHSELPSDRTVRLVAGAMAGA